MIDTTQGCNGSGPNIYTTQGFKGSGPGIYITQGGNGSRPMIKPLQNPHRGINHLCN